MNILVTGGTGFIGGKLIQKLIEEKEHKITLLTRHSTDEKKYNHLKNQGIAIEKINIANQAEIRDVFERCIFDWVFHIAAIRGAGYGTKEDYIKSNVNYTKFLAEETLKQNGKFIYCSSVGVFGTIPKELPPTEATERVGDNYYHLSKILAEEQLQKMTKDGLNLIIIRPTITYGIGDFGFPFSLIKMVDKGIFFRCRNTKIHLVDVNYLAEAFIKATTLDLKNGSVYNVVDKNPVEICDLINFISQKLKGKNYPKIKTLPQVAFKIGKKFSQLLKNEVWKTRFELISEDWYYDSKTAENDLQITPKETIPNFEYVINWYVKEKCKPRINTK